MLRSRLLLVSALLVPAALMAQTQAKATATLHNSTGAQVGTATIQPAAGGTAVQISATLTKLPPGTHAIHIHAVGKCDAPGFTTAGGHFNPAGKQHGKDNPAGPHAGDLPNFDADASGNATISLTVPGVTLGDGPNSLFHEGGTALVIHAAADDYKTDPAGNAGARIACGVITKTGA